MRTSLRDSVYSKPIFEKVAEHELPTDSSKWNEEIMKQFYSDADYIPKEIGVDVVVNEIDEKKGYAKGSIIAFFNNKQINFPIIVKDFKLSPFDIFVHKDDDDIKYYPANLENMKKVLASDEMARLENFHSKGNPSPHLKRPGGIQPKTSIDLYDKMTGGQSNPGLSKMSSWAYKARKEDLEKLAVQMESSPDVASSFVDNSGDLLRNVVELKDNEKRFTVDDHKEGVLDLKNVIKAKRVVTAIDSEMVDTNDLIPIQAPSVCELRLHQYPSMEDFIDRGRSAASRVSASKVGKSVVGVVLDVKEESDCEVQSYHGGDDKKRARNRRPQVFLSVCGKYYSKFDDYNRHGIGFYGMRTVDAGTTMERAIQIIASNTSSEFINIDPKNERDGADKSFISMNNSEQGRRRSYASLPSYYGGRLMILYGAGSAWEAMKFHGRFRKHQVNNSSVYVSDDTAIIPANIASIQKVKSVEDPVYKMVVGKVSNIFLIPETSTFINLDGIQHLDKKDFLNPDLPIQKNFEDVSMNKVAVCVSMINKNKLGYSINGEPVKPLKKIAGMGNKSFTTNETLFALQVMGMTKEAAAESLKVAMNRFADTGCKEKSVTIYGVRDDYINKDIFEGQEKLARVNKLKKEFAYSIRQDLVKEASILQDPEAVDTVLSLNFINEDSLNEYVENIPQMRRVNNELAKLLVASRMGLTDIDESALKKSMAGLTEVIKNLETVKMITKD